MVTSSKMLLLALKADGAFIHSFKVAVVANMRNLVCGTLRLVLGRYIDYKMLAG